MEDAGNQTGNQTKQQYTVPESERPNNFEQQQGPVRTRSGFKAAQIAEYVFWVLAAVVLLRFAFKLIGANSHNTFVVLVFNLTNTVVNLFKGIVGDVISGPMVIEFSSLISVLILWLMYKAVAKLITIAR
jgi:cobalamin synthase